MIGRRGHDLEIDQHGQTRRGIRAIAAAEAKHQAGAPDAAATLLAMTETGPQDEPTRARLSLLRGRMAFRAGMSGESLELLLDAADRYERLDARLARETYLEALSAALLGHRHRVGTRRRGPVPRTAERGRHRRAAVPGGDRPPELGPGRRRTCPRAPALR
jgi:hypothetical protein